MSNAIGIALPRLSRSRAGDRQTQKYAVNGKVPGFTADFIDNYYFGHTSLSSAITHVRNGNATMTDGYGPELVVNGSYSDGTTGWNTSNTSIAVNDGVATVSVSANGTAHINQALSTEIGKTYIASIKFIEDSLSGNLFLYAGTSAGNGNMGGLNMGSAVGSYELVFVATATTTYISVSSSGSAVAGDYFRVDSVSVREMPVLKWAPHNLFTESENIADADWTKSGATATQITTTLPDGTSGTASRVQDTGGGTVYQTDPVVVGQKYTVAIWAKRNGATDQTFRLFLDGLLASSDLTATEDWQLFEYETTITTGGTVSFGFTDNSSGSDNYDIIFWGAHLYRSDLGGMVDNPDRGDSYVPTTSSAKWLPRVGHHVYNGSAWANEGLLAESESRTNLATHSDMLSATVIGSTRTADNAVSPDGTENAFTITASSTAPAYIRYSGLLTSGQSYAVSVYAKAGTHDIIRIANVSSFASGQWFDLTNGTLLTSNGANNTATIQDVGNGWYRCTRYFDSVTTGSSDEIFIANSSADGATSAVSGSTFHLYGFQVENNATSSSFIPTSGSSVTRAAETFTIPSANLPWPQPVYTGSELVTNGTFDTDVSGWTDGSSGTGSISYQSGEALLTSVDSSNRGIIRQQISADINKVYAFSAQITSTTANSNYVRVGQSVGSADRVSFTSSGVGTYDGYFVGGVSGTVWIEIGGVFGTGTTTVDNISVREINPLSVSIAMDGRVTYADEDAIVAYPYRHELDTQNKINLFLDTRSTETGQFVFEQEENNIYDSVSTSATYLSPDVFVPFNVASRHGSTFVNGATDGVALTADTTPTALPDLSATDLDLAYDYMGTISVFRVWDRDIGDTGLVEATSPSLEPSLSLTFEGVGTNSFVVNDWS